MTWHCHTARPLALPALLCSPCLWLHPLQDELWLHKSAPSIVLPQRNVDQNPCLCPMPCLCRASDSHTVVAIDVKGSTLKRPSYMCSPIMRWLGSMMPIWPSSMGRPTLSLVSPFALVISSPTQGAMQCRIWDCIYVKPAHHVSVAAGFVGQGSEKDLAPVSSSAGNKLQSVYQHTGY